VYVLVWNLFHGRAVPPAGRDLLPDFRNRIEAWEWDVAFLQEVPPWWPRALPGETGDTVLTSRNFLLCLRRPLARRWPDVMKSSGGGANAILVRRGAIAERRSLVLRRRPERRVAHGVRIGATWFLNLHATAHVPARALEDVERAARAAREWAGDAPLVFGGDLNLRHPELDGFVHVGGRDVDHLFVRGRQASGPARLEHGTLSDHVPLRFRLSPEPRPDA
jgi:endonuclease/exonuclease/phosphatase family metal-dependent hydrolase